MSDHQMTTQETAPKSAGQNGRRVGLAQTSRSRLEPTPKERAQLPSRTPSKDQGRPWLPLSSDSPVFDQLSELDLGFPAEPADMDRILSAVRRGEYSFRPIAGRLAILQAIDAQSGDSILHIAARQGSYQNYLEIRKEFYHPYELWHRWAEHAFMTHENHDGDTVLHIAARRGDQKLCTSIYRSFNFNHWSAEVPEQTQIDKGAPELQSYPDDFYEGGSDPSLRFLIMTNKVGNTAEDEARAAGHPTSAQWLHDVKQRLDPDGTRSTEAGRVVLDRVITEKYLYRETIGEDYH